MFDLDKPETLQNKVFWDVLLNFCRRGQEGLHDLKSNSYMKCTDDVGNQYYKMEWIQKKIIKRLECIQDQENKIVPFLAWTFTLVN